MWTVFANIYYHRNDLGKFFKLIVLNFLINFVNKNVISLVFFYICSLYFTKIFKRIKWQI